MVAPFTSLLLGVAVLLVFRPCSATPGPCSMGPNGELGVVPGNNTAACTQSCKTNATNPCLRGYCNGVNWSACQCTDCYKPPPPLPSVINCSMTGDPHILSFSGAWYHPQPGPGMEYVAATPNGTLPAGTRPWRISFTTIPYIAGYWPMCVSTVIFSYNDTVRIEFGRGGDFFQVDYVNRAGSYYYPSSASPLVSVVPYAATYGRGYQLTTSDGVKVTYAPGVPAYCGQMSVSVPTTYRGNVEGYCVDGGSSIPPTCAADRTSTANTQCAPIKDSAGPFAACVRARPNMAQQYFDNCVYDTCTSTTPTTCDGRFADFARQCAVELPHIVLSWRTALSCPPPACPANSRFVDCASACVNTCESQNANTTCRVLEGVDRCVCNDGFVFENGQCIPVSQCGCKDSDGNYHTATETWLGPGCTQTCRCVSGVAKCDPTVGCPAGQSCLGNGAVCSCTVRWNRVTVLVTKALSLGDQLFIRGGIPHENRAGCYNVADASNPCTIPIRHIGTPIGDKKVSSWRYKDDFLDWYGPEAQQSDYSGEKAAGTPLYWTTGNVWKAEFDANCEKGVNQNGNMNFWFKAYVRYKDGREEWLGSANTIAPYCPATGISPRTISITA